MFLPDDNEIQGAYGPTFKNTEDAHTTPPL